MADNRKEEFPKCSTLFLSEDGSPMLFYMTPSAIKTKLRPLIRHGGGELSSKVLSDSIKLADPTGGGNVCGYLSTDYIFDSIKQNKLQDMEKYRLKSSPRGTVKISKPEGKISSSTNKVSGPARGGRQLYTHDEDLALLLFVKEHKAFHAIRGNNLYKEAAKAKVTTHTWQSMRDHYLKVLHNRKKPRDFNKLSFKSEKVKPAVDLKGKMLNGEAGQSRKTASQRASPSKKIVTGNEDLVEQNTVSGQSRKMASQRASPSKKIVAVSKDSVEQDTVSDNLPHVSSGDSADDESSAGEDVDYDKLFDDNLLRLAAESKAQKDRKKVDSEGTGKIGASDENKVSSSQDVQNQKTVRTRRQKPMDQQEDLSDFDGEVSAREGLKRPSAGEDGDKRPLAKRAKANLPSKPDEKEPQMNGKIRTTYQEFKLNIQRLASQWTVPKTIHALLVTSGKLDAAERYLQNGSAGKEQWGVEEDKILLSKNKEAISCVAKTKGLQSVVDRMNFMEGIN